MGQAFHNAFSESERLSSFDVLARWVESLHGQGELKTSLKQLMKLVKAESALIARFVDGSLVEKRIAAVASAEHQKRNGSFKSFSDEILGDNLKVSQPGATWSWSMTDVDRPLLDRSLTSEALQARGLSDVVMICLGVKAGTADYLELQFNRLSENDHDLIVMLSGTLASTWGMRLPGTADKLLVRRRGQSKMESQGSTPILDVENPSGLSRAEYRVCAMVREGLLVKDIAHELSICEATVRSHLHSIYAKTGVSGQVELLHRLATDRLPVGDKRTVALNGHLRAVGS